MTLKWYYDEHAAIFTLFHVSSASVFPHTVLLQSQPNDYLMIGSCQPLTPALGTLEAYYAAVPSLRADMEKIGFTSPLGLLGTTFLLTTDEIHVLTENIPLHFDNRPTLEFTAPLSLLSMDTALPYELLQVKHSFLPPSIASAFTSRQERINAYNTIGEGLFRVKNLDLADKLFATLQEMAPYDARSLVNRGRVYILQGKDLLAAEAFTKAIASDPNYALAYFHLGMLYKTQGLYEKGLSYLLKGLDRQPGDPRGSLYAAQILKHLDQNTKAQQIITTALKKPIPNTGLRNALEQELMPSQPDGITHQH